MTREERNRRAMLWALALGTGLLLAFGMAPRPMLPACVTPTDSHCYGTVTP